MSTELHTDMIALATHLRDVLNEERFILLYAYNGTGKTRLSTEFKDLGKQDGVAQNCEAEAEAEAKVEVEVEEKRDTLYFNAFTEDLFTWNNDLENDEERFLKLNTASKFFAGLDELEMDNRVGRLLARYCDFDFKIGSVDWKVRFSRNIKVGTPPNVTTVRVDDIKVSRGEENIFIWCFFLAILELAIDGVEAYKWVKYVYIDDPISSLDDQNAIAVATHLARLLKNPESPLKTVISTHHTLFFNVLCNEIKHKKGRKNRFFISRDRGSAGYILRDTSDTPFFHHVAALTELYEAERCGDLYTHHFNMLRAVLEKTASFHGYDSFSSCIKKDADDIEGVLHTRIVNLLSHGNYSLYEPREMLEENKEYFRKVLHEFITQYPFNPALFPEEHAKAATS